MAKVPITPGVLRWAIEESGHDLGEVAAAVGVPREVLAAWLAGEQLPNLTQLRKLSTTLNVKRHPELTPWRHRKLTPSPVS
jgi:ribosome-binding protein aMBF1 (putative translation factor)